MSELKYLIVLLLFASTNLYADQLLNCDGCSEAQKRNLVFQQNMSNGVTEGFYVIDFQNQTIDRYTLYFEFEIGYFKWVSNATVPQNVQNAADDYFAAARNFKANPDHQVLISVLNDMYGNTFSTNSESGVPRIMGEALSSDDTLDQCWSSDVIYDVISSSVVRQEWYDKTLNASPIYYGLVEAWNHLVGSNGVNLSLNFKDVLTADRTLSQVKNTEINFGDGGTVWVTRNAENGSIEVVPDSARDCNGNDLPTSLSSIEARYDFPDLYEYDQFRNFAEFEWGSSLIFLNPDARCINVPVQTKCRKVEGNKYECIASVPSCEY